MASRPVGASKRPNVRLCLERKRRGWTQAQLAEFLEASIRAERPGWSGLPTKQYVSRWEHGDQPEPLYFRHLLQVFAAPPEQLGLIDEAPCHEPERDRLEDVNLDQPVSRRSVSVGYSG